MKNCNEKGKRALSIARNPHSNGLKDSLSKIIFFIKNCPDRENTRPIMSRIEMVIINSSIVEVAYYWFDYAALSQLQGREEPILSNIVFFLVCILINIAFVTLFERKVLGLSQYRLGPNKARWKGLMQPIADAIKLFLKCWVVPFKARKWIFLLSPGFSILIVIFLWVILPGDTVPAQVSYSSIFFLIFLRMNIYPLIFSGWASNSKLRMIGSLRGIAQTISYEISLSIIIFNLLAISGGLYFSWVLNVLGKVSLVVPLFLIFFLWLISCIAECNRTPFDFSEGESELVSGFNTEYGGAGFAIIFIAEYGSILFFCAITRVLFLWDILYSLLSLLSFICLVFLWIWVRRTFPRYRYDKLINLCWKFILPCSIFSVFFFFGTTVVHLI